MEDLRTGGESIRSGRRPDDGSDPMPREAGPPGDRPANRSFRAEDDDQHVSPTAPSADKPDATSIGFSTYVHDACTRPPYGRVATVSGSTPLGEAGGGGTECKGIQTRERPQMPLARLVVAPAVGELSARPSSNMVA